MVWSAVMVLLFWWILFSLCLRNSRTAFSPQVLNSGAFKRYVLDIADIIQFNKKNSVLYH